MSESAEAGLEEERRVRREKKEKKKRKKEKKEKKRKKKRGRSGEDDGGGGLLSGDFFVSSMAKRPDLYSDDDEEGDEGRGSEAEGDGEDAMAVLQAKKPSKRRRKGDAYDALEVLDAVRAYREAVGDDDAQPEALMRVAAAGADKAGAGNGKRGGAAPNDGEEDGDGGEGDGSGSEDDSDDDDVVFVPGAPGSRSLRQSVRGTGGAKPSTEAQLALLHAEPELYVELARAKAKLTESSRTAAQAVRSASLADAEVGDEELRELPPPPSAVAAAAAERQGAEDADADGGGGGGARVTILVRGGPLPKEGVSVALRPSRPFLKLYNYLAKKHGMARGSFDLVFDGDRLETSQTPAELDMEDEDLVDLNVHGSGK